jgi:hypothetical protein
MNQRDWPKSGKNTRGWRISLRRFTSAIWRPMVRPSMRERLRFALLRPRRLFLGQDQVKPRLPRASVISFSERRKPRGFSLAKMRSISSSCRRCPSMNNPSNPRTCNPSAVAIARPCFSSIKSNESARCCQAMEMASASPGSSEAVSGRLGPPFDTTANEGSAGVRALRRSSGASG